MIRSLSDTHRVAALLTDCRFSLTLNALNARHLIETMHPNEWPALDRSPFYLAKNRFMRNGFIRASLLAFSGKWLDSLGLTEVFHRSALTFPA